MRKVGDKVKIKSDLQVGENYGCDSVVEEMLQYCGKEAIIEDINSYNGEYSIDIDNNDWYWTNEMFEDENN